MRARWSARDARWRAVGDLRLGLLWCLTRGVGRHAYEGWMGGWGRGVCEVVVVMGGSADLGWGWGGADRIGGVRLRGLGLRLFAPGLLLLDGV